MNKYLNQYYFLFIRPTIIQINKFYFHSYNLKIELIIVEKINNKIN